MFLKSEIPIEFRILSKNWRRINEEAFLSYTDFTVREWIMVDGKWLFIRFECESDKDKRLAKVHFLSGEKGRVSEIMQEEMQNEYNNNVFLAQVPQFCDKIYKLAKGTEKGKSANVSQTKS